MGFTNIETLAVAYLAATLNVRIATERPANLEKILPVVQVTRGPGSDDGITDTPLLDVEVFAADTATLWALTEQVRDAMRALSGRAVNGRLVDRVRTANGPTKVDFANPAVKRTVASYEMALRRT